MTSNQRNLIDTFQLGIPSNLIFDENGRPHGNEILYEAAKRHRIMKEIFIEWARQVGKTTSCGILGALCGAFPHLLRTISGKCLETISLGYFAPVEEKSLKLMDETRRNFKTSTLRQLLPSKRDSLFKDNQMEMILTNYSQFVAYNSSAKSVRGGSHHVDIIDETGQIPKDFFETCVNATSYEIGERLAFSGTPEGVWSYHYVLKQRSRTNSYRVCQNCGFEFDMGAFGAMHKWDYNPDTDSLFTIGGSHPPCPVCGVPHDDEHFMFTDILPIVVNPWIRISKSPKWVWEELQKWGNDPLIRQELLCEEVQSGSFMFPRLDVYTEYPRGCYTPWLGNGNTREYEKKVAGIDLGKHRDHSAICILHKEDEDLYVIDYAHRWPLKIDYHQVRMDILNILRSFRVTEVVIDSYNPGEAVADELKHDLEGEIDMYEEDGKIGFRGTPNKKKEILQNLQLRVTNHQIQIPNSSDSQIAQLMDELATFSYKKSMAGNVIFGVQTSPDDMVLALAMALRGFGKFIYPKVTPGVVKRDVNPVFSVRQTAIHGQTNTNQAQDRKRDYFSRDNRRAKVSCYSVRYP